MTLLRRAPLSLPALLAGRRLPLVMGIVNATPDSFFDGGRHASVQAAIEHGLKLAAEGADLLDVGGESTRPGSSGVDEAEERRRILPVIEALAQRTGLPVSVDTSKAAVAQAAFEAGASILNDVTALRGDLEMAALAARAGVPVVLMHMQGTPRDMQNAPSYTDAAAEVAAFLEERRKAFQAAGGDPLQVLLDPGIGFGKNLDHNLDLLRALPRLAALGPVLVGASRKAFLGRLMAGEVPGGTPLPADRLPPPSERLGASLACALAAASRGAAVLRVHDVAETRGALSAWRALA